ncbi:MAG: D-tyrosyl-tRNA(Tyr) deacylase [Planctomycetes bacterium]|nr:D-tyrosyl-tRNA(Tyr) deacylase [Planctomycetota bacterium]
MRAVVQRVSRASVEINDGRSESIGQGLLIYLGVARDDDNTDTAYLVDKIRHLRIFSDENGKQNLDIHQAGGEEGKPALPVLVVSAFTVQADARKGRRPSFEAVARGEKAEALYEKFCSALRDTGLCVKTGSFGSYMSVKCDNDGPICILLDSRRTF